jgi:ATP-dependent DNA helicase RecQ
VGVPNEHRSDPTATPERLLARFGLSAFRPGQREAVGAALQRRDTLVVMPTGGGKSLCYQLPALLDGALVVVVSPLIALMADQLDRLQHAGVSAAMLASGMAEGHNAQALRSIRSGEVRLVLAAPERFASRAFRDALAERNVSLFVVDEAHCVAEWGHDFRPDYLRLHGAIEALGRPPVMAATATATPRVAEEIAARLQLRDPAIVRSGFDRPNISFDVLALEGKGAVARKRATLLFALGEATARPAIVYCGTRKDTEDVCALLRGEGFAAVAYHAGMSGEARAQAQSAFMRGDAEIVVATNAFGMGVDKADVRTVAHWALPTSLEGYYQEAGRAGRDGRAARALLLASRYDLGRLIKFNNARDTSVEEVREFVGRLRREAGGDDRVEVGHGSLGERERMLLSIAERAGAAVLEPGQGGGLLVRLTGQGSSRAAQSAIKAAKDRGWEAYRAIEGYIASGMECRRRTILEHFGDREPPSSSVRCCDVCEPDPDLVEAALRALPPRRSRSERTASTGSRAGARTGGFGTNGAVEREPLDPAEEAAFEKLKAWRLARSEGKPAYTVAANAALEGVLRARPATVQELIAVRGIGPTFCERHGESLLAVLTELGGGRRELPSADPGAVRRDIDSVLDSQL